MSPYAITAAIALVAVLAALVHIAANRPTGGNATLAGLLAVAFGAYSAWTIAREGPFGFWPNHTQDLWGLQVWIDLLSAVTIALLFIAPRARAVGMRVPVWTLVVAATASIGLFAMAVRLFWLESRKPGG